MRKAIRRWFIWAVATAAWITGGCTAKKPVAAVQPSTVPSTVQPVAAPVSRPIVRVGGDRDEHGCIRSAGYTFSQNRDKCIRLFEDGIRLNPRDASLNQTTSAFVVLKADAPAAPPELFLPDGSPSFLMAAAGGSGAGTWTYQQYTLTLSEGVYTLKNASGAVLYQGRPRGGEL